MRAAEWEEDSDLDETDSAAGGCRAHECDAASKNWSLYFAGFAQWGAVVHFDVSKIDGSIGTSTFQSEYSSA